MNSGSSADLRIVVLDGYALNPGDLSWDLFHSIGSCTIHDRTAPHEIVPRARGATILFTNKTPLDAATLGQLPSVRYIGVLATGHNVVDGAAARARRITVTNVPSYGTAAVAQHTWALVLELANRAGRHADSVAAGAWARSPDWCYWEHPLTELDGLTLGIVGWGRIGQAVARGAVAFGMNVIVHSRQAVAGVPNVPLDELFARSDVISLHCPLTPDTQGMVNARRLELMKRSAFLVNTSRGPLVVEADLAAALNADRIAGAGLDVLAAEPPAADHPLVTARNCIVTPHIAWAARAARRRLLVTAAANACAFLNGAPQNVVNS